MARNVSMWMFGAFVLVVVFSPLLFVVGIFMSEDSFQTIAKQGELVCETRSMGIAISGGETEVRVSKLIGHGLRRVYYDKTVSYGQDGESFGSAGCYDGSSPMR